MFQTTDWFLMPYPGEIVATNEPKFTGAIDGIVFNACVYNVTVLVTNRNWKKVSRWNSHTCSGTFCSAKHCCETNWWTGRYRKTSNSILHGDE